MPPNAKNEKDKEEEEDDKKKKKLNSVGVFEIFAFADKWDVLLIVLGMIGAIIAGSIFPFMFYIFGNITDGFTTYQVQHASYNCDNSNVCAKNASETLMNKCNQIDDKLKVKSVKN